MKRTVSLIGTGRLARALLPQLQQAGYRVAMIAGRRDASARALCRGRRGVRPTVVPEKAAEAAELTLLAVPDRRIQEVARRLAAARRSWSGKTFLHHAGALGPEPLQPLSRAGAAVGLLHPLQALGAGPEAGARLRGSFARIEGDARALPVARELARALGLELLPLRGPLTDRQRRLYHAAASLVANDALALLAAGTELFGSLGIDEGTAVRALSRLALGTLDQAERGGLDTALTGPVSRGDRSTVEAQLASLASADRSAAELHRRLSLRLLERVQRRTPLSPAELRRWKRLLGGGSGRRGV